MATTVNNTGIIIDNQKHNDKQTTTTDPCYNLYNMSKTLSKRISIFERKMEDSMKSGRFRHMTTFVASSKRVYVLTWSAVHMRV